MSIRKNTKIYLDYAATTPVDPTVLKAMEPYFTGKFGNAGSLHSFGQEAMATLDKSREAIANSIGAKFNEVIFTGSATEANNLALRGAMSKVRRQNSKVKPRIIVSAIEHESILETAKDLEKDGVEVIYLPVDKSGFVDLIKLRGSINERTVLVSIMYANNEIGTIQDIKEAAKIIRHYKESSSRLKTTNYQLQTPLLHTDAVQAFQYLDCNVDNLHVDLMTLSAHKIYASKGVGMLYVRGVGRADEAAQKLSPMVTGGGQEFGFRSATENIPGIVGFAKAVEIVTSDKKQETRGRETDRVRKLRDYLWKGIRKIYPKAQLNGDRKNRLPNNLNIYLPGVSSEDLLIKLDIAGVAISSGSACAARSLEPSYVIEELGFSKERASQSVRISLGRPTSKSDIDIFLARVVKLSIK